MLKIRNDLSRACVGGVSAELRRPETEFPNHPQSFSVSLWPSPLLCWRSWGRSHALHPEQLTSQTRSCGAAGFHTLHISFPFRLRSPPCHLLLFWPLLQLSVPETDPEMPEGLPVSGGYHAKCPGVPEPRMLVPKATISPLTYIHVYLCQRSFYKIQHTQETNSSNCPSYRIMATYCNKYTAFKMYESFISGNFRFSQIVVDGQ